MNKNVETLGSRLSQKRILFQSKYAFKRAIHYVACKSPLKMLFSGSCYRNNVFLSPTPTSNILKLSENQLINTFKQINEGNNVLTTTEPLLENV